MRVILFGATGMVGQGVLRECLLDDRVEAVLSIGRSATGQRRAKFREIVHADLFDLSALADELTGYDACFFCLGVSSVGMTAEEYKRITHDLTLTIAGTFARLNPAMTFIYLSAAGSDRTGRSRARWARLRGAAENDLLELPFKVVCSFRPFLIVPLDGIRSKTRVYRVTYTLLGPLLPALAAAFPKYVTTTRRLGRAMLAVAAGGAPLQVLENADINRLGEGAA